MNTAQLIQYIDTKIKANGNREITGPVMNDVLKKVMTWALGNTASAEPELILPTVSLVSKFRDDVTNFGYVKHPRLLMKVNEVNQKYRKYNPQIWLFRYRQRSKEKINYNINTHYKSKIVKWAHPVHKNGEGYQGAWFTGEDNENILDVFPRGRDTEFKILDYKTYFSNEEFNPMQWFSRMHGKMTDGFIPFTNDINLDDGINAVHLRNATGMKGISQRFRFAVVIDDPENPYAADGYPRKIIGEMSDEFIVRPLYVNDTVQTFAYEFGRYAFKQI